MWGWTKRNSTKLLAAGAVVSQWIALWFMHKEAPIVKERLDALLAECKRTTIDAIIGPFGLSYALFADKDGGYVDTVHNVREGVWVDDEAKRRYDGREEYDSGKYHADQRYRDRNAETSRRRKAGETIADGYSDRPIKPDENKDLDHVISAKETHEDPALVLADLDSPEDKLELANDESNFQDTNRHINRGKGELSMDEYIEARKKKISNIEDTISKLEQKQREGSLTDGQKRALEEAKAAKKKFDEDGFNEEKARVVRLMGPRWGFNRFSACFCMSLRMKHSFKFVSS